MEVFLRIDINLIAVILLGSICIISYRRLDRKDNLNNAFLKVSVIIMLELLIESATCIINKIPEKGLIPISTILHIALFTVSPLLTYFWFYFIRNLVSNTSEAVKKIQAILLLPILINFIATVTSPFTHFIFYIDSSNIYHRGDFFIVYTLITYLYVFMGLVFILMNSKNMISRDFFPLLILGIVPMLGALIQVIFYGILLMWSSVAFSLVVVYVFLQQRMVQLDYLTGVWDRSSFDYYISKRTARDKNYQTGIIYMDIDDLKIINDNFGHSEGDFVLKKSVELIKSSLRKEDIIARMGGDEFVIILEAESKKTLQSVIKKLEEIISSYGKTSKKPYNFSCSFGGSVFDSSKENICEFLKQIDSLMYKNKAAKKNNIEKEGQ